MLQAFEWELPADSAHWKRLENAALLLTLMGITSVWMPPACKGSGGIHDVGYGVYDLYDLGEFSQKGTVATKYGTLAQLQQAVRALHCGRIQVLGDCVLNHRIGADEKENVTVTPIRRDARREALGAPYPAVCYTRFTFPGRGTQYSAYVWDHASFSGVDYAEPGKENALYLLADHTWSDQVDMEMQSFDYLMGCNVDHQKPYVAEELTRWGLWFLEKTGMDGFRLDAVKHIHAPFFPAFLGDIRNRTRREVYAVGEYWNADTGALLSYLERTGYCMDLFDVPLHFRLQAASASMGQFDMRTLFDGTLTAARPASAVTFVDNHDTQPGQSLESWVQGWFKKTAYALILLREAGYPCVFWGDLYGIPAAGIGKVPELPLLLTLRRERAYGPQRDYMDDPHIIGFVREGLPELPFSGLVVLCTNAEGGEKRMQVGPQLSGKRLVCLLGGQKDVTVSSDGYASFSVADAGLSVYGLPGGVPSLLHRMRWQLQTAGSFALRSLASRLLPVSLANLFLKG